MLMSRSWSLTWTPSWPRSSLCRGTKRLDAFDWNCPQHITSRFTKREIAEAVRPLQERLAELEAEIAKLRAERGVVNPIKQERTSA
jgi:hypothetical protein